jgi:tRNA A37 threonylcarbamoyltransferase TsaD
VIEFIDHPGNRKGNRVGITNNRTRMSKLEFTAIEKEMANFDFSGLETQLQKAKTNMTAAKSPADVKTEICQVWSKIRKYVVLAENIPIVGKFIKILADLLDSLCGA